MIIPEDCSYLFKWPGAKKWLTRKRGIRPGATFVRTTSLSPKVGTEDFVYSLDKCMLTLTETLAERYNREFPVDSRPSGFAGPSAVPGTFDALRSVTQYGMNPLPIPISNNAEFVKAQGVASDIEAADIPWLVELVRLFFGHAVPASCHIRIDASTGFPFFTTDNKYKKGETLHILRNIDDFLNAACGKKDGLVHLLNRYNVILTYAIQERQQPDSCVKGADGKLEGKPRTAPTEEEARSGQYTGQTFADKTVRDADGNVIEGHFAMRRRDVFGMNGPVNYALTAILGCFRAVYLNRFSFTYKTRDRADKKSKAERFKFIIGSDVKTMDKLVPKWFMDRVLSEMTKYVDERVVELLRRCFQAPYVVPPPWRETPAGYNPVFGGSALDPNNFKQFVGLPSGIAINPDWGKLWMTFVYTTMYRRIGALKSPAELEPLLRGIHPDHGLLDMSDDATFLTNSSVMAERMAKGKSPYAILEQEIPVLYLGDVFCEVSGRREVYPNPITFSVNMCAREDSLESLARDPNKVIQYAEGVMARLQVYAPTPTFRDQKAIFEEEARRHLGFNPLMIARMNAKKQKFANEIDALVRMNPHVIHYRVDPSTVSPEVLDDVVATIPANDFWEDIRPLFKVPTVSLQEFV